MNNSIQDTKLFYSCYNEDIRIKQDKSHRLEFILSIKTIEKYLTPETSVIDVGCGTGNYSIELAPKCKEVLATDLMPNLIDILQNKIKQNHQKNISCLCVNVLNIPKIVHKKYDLILCMGPLYHLDNPKDREVCYQNLKEIASENSVFIFTYLAPLAALSGVLKEKMKFHIFFDAIKNDSFYMKPFFFSDPNVMKNEIESNAFKILEHLPLDPIAGICRNQVNTFSEESYQDIVETLINNNPEPKLLYLSAHNMIVAQLFEK